MKNAVGVKFLFVVVGIILLLGGCGKTGAQITAGGSQADWKQVYLEELLEAQAYAANTGWENYDPESRYPIELYGAQLIDLNFDGVPELFLFGPGAGASQDMRIIAINANGAEMIFHGWGSMGDASLYRYLYRVQDGVQENYFGFQSANGDLEHYGGEWYLTSPATKMDTGFAGSAKHAGFLERHEFDDDGNHLGSHYTINGRVLEQDDYRKSLGNIFDGYGRLPFLPVGIVWDSGWHGDSYSITLLTEYEIMSFLDAFTPDNGYFGPAYGIADFTAEDLIDYLLANVEDAYERVYVMRVPMTPLVTGDTVDLGDIGVCRLVFLGTDHEDHFVREIQYAISPNGDIYKYDPMGDAWLLMYVFGAVG